MGKYPRMSVTLLVNDANFLSLAKKYPGVKLLAFFAQDQFSWTFNILLCI